VSTPPAPDAPQPASQDDIRGLRRWLLVAAVWAAAATAIAVIALIQATQDDTDEISAQTADQIERVQRDLNQRLDDIEEQLGDLAPAEDVTRLDNRLKKVENAASKSTDRLDTISSDVDDLKTRVDDLEQQAEATPPADTDSDAETP
jgi:septal ring factor EnvC (AmiA/AmiB activator)